MAWEGQEKKGKQEARGYPVLRRMRTRRLEMHEGGSRQLLHREGKKRDEGSSERKKASKEEMNAAHQQAVLQSLASYLEGELMTRLKAFAELLGEVDSVSKERLFYLDKLYQIEKVCEQAQPSGAVAPLLESVISILRNTADQPHIC